MSVLVAVLAAASGAGDAARAIAALLACLVLAMRLPTPLWQLVMPGTLIHLEGAPTVAGTKVFMGGGAYGIVVAGAAPTSRSPAGPAPTTRTSNW